VRRQLVLAPDGVARVDLPTGAWELSVEVSGRGRSASARVEVRGAPVEVTLTLEASVTVHGTVTDEATHLPIFGAFVEARSYSPSDPSSFRVTVVTDARGDFVLPPTPKRAVLVAHHPKYKKRERAVGGAEPWLVSLTPEPAPHDDAPALQFEGIGMMIEPDLSRGPRVAGVNDGSPAERAGVQKGDVIVMIDGAPANTLPMEQLISRIRGPAGTEVRLAFMRGGQQFELSIRRRMLTL
jgi:membrane-associated protease RseP (regulator of RpoE activity)